jgi:predicted dehydrogenase
LSILKVGVVGAGYIAQTRHLPTWQKQKSVKIRAISDIDLIRARKVAKLSGIPATFRTLEEMLEHESLDIIDICTPAASHAPLSLQALTHRNSANVIVEKPMAMNLSSAKLVYDAARKSNRKFTVVHNYRFSNLYRMLRASLIEGKLGHVRDLDASFEFPHSDFNDQFLPSFPYGILFETGVHDIDLARDLLGDVREVNAIVTKKAHGHAHSVVSMLRHHNGTVSTLRLSFDSAGYSHRLILNGSKSKAILDFNHEFLEFQRKFDVTRNVTLFSFSMSLVAKYFLAEAIISLRRAGRSLKGMFSISSALPFGATAFGGLQPFESIINEFVRCIMEDTPPPITMEEAFSDVRIAEAAKLSAELGVPRKLVSGKQ